MPSMSSSSSSSSSSTENLEREGLTWLLVVAVGFFFGMGWVSGPLGWYFGQKLRRQAEAADVITPDVVRFAHIGGIVTTIVSYVGLLVALVAIVVIFGFLAVGVQNTSFPINQ